MESEATALFDGGARPNPGPAAIGCMVNAGAELEKDGKHVGESTNNRAECRTLSRELENALEMDCSAAQAEGGFEGAPHPITPTPD